MSSLDHHRWWRHRLVTAIAVIAAVSAAGDVSSMVPASSAGGAVSGGMEAGGSIDEAWLTGVDPGDAITLLRNGSPVTNPANPGTADSFGSLIVRDLTPGSGYAWKDTPPRHHPHLHGARPVSQPGDRSTCTPANPSTKASTT